MNTIPVVSIVTPSLNQGKYIEETIRSVLSQEGDFYLDYIVIDGVSTDNSLDVIKKYDTLVRAGSYPVRCRGIEYRWISERDQGQSEAINKGFSMVRGEIAAYLNSDDTYSPGSVQQAVNCFREHPKIGLVHGDGYSIMEEGSRKYYRYPYTFTLKCLKKGYNLSQPSVFVRKKVLDKVGPLDTRLHFTMDYDWFVRIAYQFRGKYINFPLGNCRHHACSKTYDKILPDFRAEMLLLIRKYGGARSFVRAFGEDVLQYTQGRQLTHESSFGMLKSAVGKRMEAIDFPIRENLFLAGYAYFFLCDAIIVAHRDRKRAIQDCRFVLRSAPSLFLSYDGLVVFLKLLFPEKQYTYLKNHLKR